MAQIFAKGDVVQLKSGGPEMTVQSVDSKWINVIYWNKATSKYDGLDFYPETLIKINGFDPNADPEIGDY